MKAKMFKFVTMPIFLLVSSILLLLGDVIVSQPAFAHTVVSSVQIVKQTATSACLQPPQHVNLMTLSDAELMSYDLPTHATINTNPKHWASVLSHIKHRTCGSSTASVEYSHQHISPLCHSGLCNSPNWAGNEAFASRGTYRAADVIIHVPAINTSNHDAHVSLWAGVGGDTDSDVGGSSAVVVQAGVDVSVNAFGGQYNESWWEVYPGVAEQNLPLQRLNVGDVIEAYAESNLNNSGYNYFFMQNNSDGTGDFNGHYDYSHFSDSATGECVVERPTNLSNGTFYPLAQFSQSGQPANTVQLQGCVVNKNNDSKVYPIGSVTHFYSQIYSGSTLLASVGPITNNGYDYTVVWHHS